MDANGPSRGNPLEVVVKTIDRLAAEGTFVYEIVLGSIVARNIVPMLVEIILACHCMYPPKSNPTSVVSNPMMP